MTQRPARAADGERRRAAGVLAAVVTVSVALPEPVMLAGANEADVFAGSPSTLRLTVPLKPFSASTETV